MALQLAIFGIENDGVNLAINLLILFLVVVYLALIAYTYLDARRRLEDPVLVGCATVASLFPFLGTIVYSILRPPEFLEDRRERELEIRASELRVRQLEENSCPNCEHPVERTYLRCPSCRARIKDPCESCGKPVDPRWSLCPYCETPTRRKEPESSGKRTSRRATRPTRAKRPVSRSSDAAKASGESPKTSERPPSRSSSEARPATTRRTTKASQASQTTQASQAPPARRSKPADS
ncbi:MAG TPA: zinc ribbon domain-containing protein [Solirubrobacterales bacterium]|nr:zinc ribbon domain-containing protein [Solirubrobacterales bacterium]